MPWDFRLKISGKVTLPSPLVQCPDGGLDVMGSAYVLIVIGYVRVLHYKAEYHIYYGSERFCRIFGDRVAFERPNKSLVTTWDLWHTMANSLSRDIPLASGLFTDNLITFRIFGTLNDIIMWYWY